MARRNRLRKHHVHRKANVALRESRKPELPFRLAPIAPRRLVPRSYTLCVTSSSPQLASMPCGKSTGGNQANKYRPVDRPRCVGRENQVGHVHPSTRDVRKSRREQPVGFVAAGSVLGRERQQGRPERPLEDAGRVLYNASGAPLGMAPDAPIGPATAKSSGHRVRRFRRDSARPNRKPRLGTPWKFPGAGALPSPSRRPSLPSGTCEPGNSRLCAKPKVSRRQIDGNGNLGLALAGQDWAARFGFGALPAGTISRAVAVGMSESELRPYIRCMLAPADLDLRVIAPTAKASEPR